MWELCSLFCVTLSCVSCVNCEDVCSLYYVTVSCVSRVRSAEEAKCCHSAYGASDGGRMS